VKDWYLKEVIKHPRAVKGISYEIKGPDFKVKWSGVRNNLWPKADIWLESKNNIIIVEIDNNSDPVRSLIKYWPFFQEHFQDDESKEILFLEICEFGSTVGEGYKKLFDFISKKFADLYPNHFDSKFKIRTKDDSKVTAQWIISNL